MKIEKVLRTILVWLPSVVISIFFIQNAFDKIFYSDQMEKVISSGTAITMVGIILLIATALFLLNKTIIFGTAILAFYMTAVVFLHMYKGKPFEVAILIVATTVFAAYLRTPQLFSQKGIK